MDINSVDEPSDSPILVKLINKIGRLAALESINPEFEKELIELILSTIESHKYSLSLMSGDYDNTSLIHAAARAAQPELLKKLLEIARKQDKKNVTEADKTPLSFLAEELCYRALNVYYRGSITKSELELAKSSADELIGNLGNLNYVNPKHNKTALYYLFSWDYSLHHRGNIDLSSLCDFAEHLISEGAQASLGDSPLSPLLASIASYDTTIDELPKDAIKLAKTFIDEGARYDHIFKYKGESMTAKEFADKYDSLKEISDYIKEKMQESKPSYRHEL